MATTHLTPPEDPILRLLPPGKLVVLCGRDDDAQSWRDSLGPDRCLAVALDSAMRDHHHQPVSGASGQVAWQNNVIAGLHGPGWLAAEVAAYDPDHTATLVIPDPLQPHRWGTRARLGAGRPAWRLVEDKSAVDCLWDAIDQPRAPSLVVDLDDGSRLSTLGALLNRGAGVVCNRQPVGIDANAGGDGIWWWHGDTSPAGLNARPGSARYRLMPLLRGQPVRLHGFVTARTVVVFPPLEIVALPRPATGTFLCAGVAHTLGNVTELAAATGRLGERIRRLLDYRGGFSVDGILTGDGFRPTDFNARLTSAMEAAPPPLRVRMQAANLLVRHGVEPDASVIEHLADTVFSPSETHTLFGAASQVTGNVPTTVRAAWDGLRLAPCDRAGRFDVPDAELALQPSPRGWLLTARLNRSRMPIGGPLGALAPEVFRLSDDVFGTDFGPLLPPLPAAPE